MAVKVKEDRFDQLSKRLHRIQSILYAAGAAIVILFAMLVYGISQNKQAIDQGHKAVCGTKQQLERNIKSTENFLQTHPKGIPGVPNKLLLQGLEQDKAQLKALGPVSCS